MNAKDRIAALLHEARVAGGWDDEAVAKAVLSLLGLDEDGRSLGDGQAPVIEGKADSPE
jgi:hypothetical protein